MEVNAQVTEGGSVSFEYEFGSSLDQAVELFGEDIVWAYTLRALVIASQGHARGLIKSGKSADEIRTSLETWKPGAPRISRSPEERVRELMDKMSPEDRAAILSELQELKGEPAPMAAKHKKAAA